MSALQCKHLFGKKQKKQNQTQKSEYYLLYNFTFCCKKLNLLTHCHEASITLSDEWLQLPKIQIMFLLKGSCLAEEANNNL